MVVAFLGLSPSQLLAQSAPTEINRISPSEVDEKLNPSEFFLNGQQTGFAENLEDLYAPPLFNQQGTTRTIEWQMRVREDQLPEPNEREVTYEVKADNLTANSFKQDNSNSTIPVTIESTEFETFPDDSDSTVVFKGKITLKFDVSQFRAAGEYGGRVSICVKDKSNGCIGN